MTDALTKDDAIKAALAQDWTEAIRINSSLLESNESDIDTLNRLGFAYLKNGQLDKSKTTFKKVLALDEYNTIAQKNIDKLNLAKSGVAININGTSISPMLFLEEPGKTKIVECINLAPTSTLSVLSCGQEMFFKARSHSVEVRDANNTYIGALPDDIAFKLLKLLEAGNEYSIFIRNVNKSCVSIFIREKKRAHRLTNQPSFIGTTNYIPYTTDTDIDKKKAEMSETEEEEGPTPPPAEE